MFHWYEPFVRDIKAPCGRDWRCQHHHVYREANKVADLLAKIRANSAADCDWEEPPQSLLPLLHADQRPKGGGLFKIVFLFFFLLLFF